MKTLSNLLKELIKGNIGDPDSTIEMLNALDSGLNPLPDQTGHSGKVLQTNGTDASWSGAISAAVGPAGSVQFTDGGGNFEAGKLVWDDTNKVLDIGTVGSGALPSGSPGLYVGGNTQPVIIQEGAGTNIFGTFSGRHARGTLASPTAAQSGDILAHFSGNGYNGTTYTSSAPGVVQVATVENFSGSAMGTEINFLTTPATTTTRQKVASFTADGALGLWDTTTHTHRTKLFGANTSTPPSLILPTSVGTAGQVLTTDGASPAQLTWSTVAATPGGSSGQLQWNNSGAFAGSTVTTDGTNLFMNSGNFYLSNPGAFVVQTGTGPIIDGSGNKIALLANRVLQFSDGRTSVDWQNGVLNFDGPSSAILSVNWANRQLFANDGTTVSLDYSSPTGLKIGAYTLPLTDGTANQVLETDGAGNVTWQTMSGGGLTNPLANNTWLQWNDTSAVAQNILKLSSTQFVGVDVTNLTGPGAIAIGEPGTSTSPIFINPPSLGGHGQLLLSAHPTHNDNSEIQFYGSFLEIFPSEDGAGTVPPLVVIYNTDESHSVSLTVDPALTTDPVLVLPSNIPSANQALMTDGSTQTINGYTAYNTAWTNVSGSTKITKTFTDFATAASTNSITLFSLPAATVIEQVFIVPSASFTGGTISAYNVSVGISGNNAKYASAFDVFQAPGSTVAQLSTSPNFEDLASPVSITITATSTGDTLDHATTGSVDIYVITRRMF